MTGYLRSDGRKGIRDFTLVVFLVGYMVKDAPNVDLSQDEQ